MIRSARECSDGWVTVTDTGVNKLLSTLNPHKAPGPDQIKLRLLKECAKEIAPIFTILFNRSITCASIPFDWSRSGKCNADI